MSDINLSAVIESDTTPDEELTFIHPDDVALYNAWDSRAFELQVANHELLGHGSGKLFEEYANGKKNFDPEKVSLIPQICASVSAYLLPMNRSLTHSRARRCMFVKSSYIFQSGASDF